MSFIEMDRSISRSNYLNQIRPNTKICLVVDYPSYADVQLNSGLSDSAGAVVAQCLGHAGMSMADVSVIFVIPNPSNASEFVSYWTPKSGFSSKATQYWQDLKTVIESIKEQITVFVPLGEVPLQALTNCKGITKWHGSILTSIDYYGGVKVIPSMDPRSCIRTYLWRYFMSHDFKKIKGEANFRELNLPERTYIIQPSWSDSMAYLRSIQPGSKVAVDIEIFKLEVSCISFAKSETNVISIPFDGSWTIEEEAQVWREVDRVLSDPSIDKIFQNGMFDMSFLFQKNHIITRGYIHDTMIKHNLNYPDFPKNLGFITTLYTREPYYKDEGKQAFKDGGASNIRQFYTYNAKDSAITFEANDKIQVELEKFGNDKTYNFCEALMRPLLYMQARGVLVDAPKLTAHRKQAKEEQEKLQLRLNELCGFNLNVSSPAQCKLYFYTTKGYAPQTKRTKDAKTGARVSKISSDDKAMKKLIRKYQSEEAKLVTQIRKYRKLIGTYLDVSYDNDGRLRCSFSIAGTSSGRLSSSETIFGTGTNMQNLPKTFKEFLVADPGCVIIEMDKAQAEWVATAYIAGEARMIEAVESGIDAHVHTANLMFNIPKELIIAEHELLETTTDEDYILELRSTKLPEILNYRNLLPNMSCRQAGKKSNHSFNYGLSPQGFAIQYDLDPKYAKLCYDLYHYAYPGLKLWHRNIENKLGRDRTLENLFGRKRRFLNRWNDDLFKAAYSFPPQSTVGELLNRGLVSTYYQQDLEGYEHLRAWDLLNQVHDSMVFQYKIMDLVEGEWILNFDKLMDLAKTIKTCLNNLDIELYTGGRKFTIKTDCKVGPNFKKLFNIDCYATTEEIYSQLLTTYETKLKVANPEVPIIDLDEIEEEDESEITDIMGD